MDCALSNIPSFVDKTFPQSIVDLAWWVPASVFRDPFSKFPQSCTGEPALSLHSRFASCRELWRTEQLRTCDVSSDTGQLNIGESCVVSFRSTYDTRNVSVTCIKISSFQSSVPHHARSIQAAWQMNCRCAQHNSLLRRLFRVKPYGRRNLLMTSKAQNRASLKLPWNQTHPCKGCLFWAGLILARYTHCRCLGANSLCWFLATDRGSEVLTTSCAQSLIGSVSNIDVPPIPVIEWISRYMPRTSMERDC